MRIKNLTHWQTRDLRAIINRVAQVELEGEQHRDRRRALQVRIVYSRPGSRRRAFDGAARFVTGCAALGGRWMTLRVSSTLVDPVAFAAVTAHEMAHLRGMTHDQMNGSPAYDCWTDAARALYAWAAPMAIGRRPAPPQVDPAGALEQRCLHAEAMLAHWRRRARLAATKIKKWQRRRKVLEARKNSLLTTRQNRLN